MALTARVLWKIFCMFLVLLYLLHAVSISVLLLIELKYLVSSHYAFQTLSVSLHTIKRKRFTQTYQFAFSLQKNIKRPPDYLKR